MSKKSCLECDLQFFGRIDKKFCTDSCRSQYHNRKKQNENELNKMINRLLHRNWKILNEMHDEGRKVVHRDLLIGKGFSFNYYTSEQELNDRNVYRFCYDQGYRFSDKELVSLQKFRHNIFS